MLFLEHAQSDEWDSLLVKKLLVTKRNMRSGSGALSTWGTNLVMTRQCMMYHKLKRASSRALGMRKRTSLQD